MKSQIITLQINFDPDKHEEPPANWNWPMLLDGPGVKVIAQVEPQDDVVAGVGLAEALEHDPIDADARWVHEDCGQIVAEDEAGYHHLNNLKECVTLGGAFPNFGLKEVLDESRS